MKIEIPSARVTNSLLPNDPKYVCEYIKEENLPNWLQADSQADEGQTVSSSKPQRSQRSSFINKSQVNAQSIVGEGETLESLTKKKKIPHKKSRNSSSQSSSKKKSDKSFDNKDENK